MSINTIGKYKLPIIIILLIILNVGVYTIIAKGLKTFRFNKICKDCNVIMVSLDTLSANHLPCYGYQRNTSPNLCSFAEKNIFFENVYANAPWTLPSHVSVFTGLFPFRHGVNHFFDELSADKKLLPEILKDNGYNTMLFMPPHDLTLPIKGVYGRLGDDVYSNDKYTWEKSIEMFKESAKSNKKTFMFLHTYDVHSPYNIEYQDPMYPTPNKNIPVNWGQVYNNFSPEFIDYYVSEINKGIDSNAYWQADRENAKVLFAELLSVYPDYDKSVAVVKKIRESNIYLIESSANNFNYFNKISRQKSEDAETLRSLYDQTINILDERKIPLLTNLLEDPVFKNNTILVVFSDHGEEFMQHGHLFHETIYNTNLRVPLIMYVPKQLSKRVSNATQLVDVAPTILDLLSIDTQIKFDGVSLVNSMLGRNVKKELLVTDGTSLESKSLTYDGWKLILSKQKDGSYLPYELYNLQNDPGENNNVLFGNDKVKDNLLQMYFKIKQE